MKKLATLTLALLAGTLVLGKPAVAAENEKEIEINCSSAAAKVTISGILAKLDPTEVHTIRVSGACTENVVIQGFDRLTLIANPGASINDASSGNLPTLDIEDSQRIMVQGFTINGGAPGVFCAATSLCRFKGNTIQGSAGDGVTVNFSRAGFDGDVIQDNTSGRGLAIINSSIVGTSGVTIQRNGAGAGVILNSQGYLFATNTTVRDNANNGILAASNSTVRLLDSTITGNGGDGVRLQEGSVARIDTFGGPGNVITNNGRSGVVLEDLSFASFATGNNVSANNKNTGGVGNDVTCRPQFSATRGALTNIGSGKTNCSEP